MMWHYPELDSSCSTLDCGEGGGEPRQKGTGQKGQGTQDKSGWKLSRKGTGHPGDGNQREKRVGTQEKRGGRKPGEKGREPRMKGSLILPTAPLSPPASLW